MAGLLVLKKCLKNQNLPTLKTKPIYLLLYVLWPGLSNHRIRSQLVPRAIYPYSLGIIRNFLECLKGKQTKTSNSVLNFSFPIVVHYFIKMNSYSLVANNIHYILVMLDGIAPCQFPRLEDPLSRGIRDIKYELF